MKPLQETRPFRGYSDERLPLGGYALLVGAYAGLALAAYATATRGTRRLPERYDLGDIALVGLATHKLSRIVTKDWVLAPFRAPFTKLEGNAGGGEFRETSRGTGLRAAVGDLLTCNYCMGPWIAGGLLFGLAMRPRETRLLAGTFAVVAISDFLHVAYQIVMAENTRLASRVNGNGGSGD